MYIEMILGFLVCVLKTFMQYAWVFVKIFVMLMYDFVSQLAIEGFHLIVYLKRKTICYEPHNKNH